MLLPLVKQRVGSPDSFLVPSLDLPLRPLLFFCPWQVLTVISDNYILLAFHLALLTVGLAGHPAAFWKFWPPFVCLFDSQKSLVLRWLGCTERGASTGKLYLPEPFASGTSKLGGNFQRRLAHDDWFPPKNKLDPVEGSVTQGQ